jgi:kynurenine formamidase
MAGVDRDEFDALFTRLSAGDRWGDADRGAWNTISPASVLAAARTVRSGRTVAMALPWNTEPAPDNHKPALHLMSDLGDREPPEPSTNKDFIAVDYHGKAVSHLDALSHIAYRGRLFGGRSSREVVDATGAHFGSVASLGHFVGRGVLIDMPVVRGVDWLEPGTPVHATDVLEAEERLGVRIAEADAVLLRTGHKRRRNTLGPWDSSDASAGLHVDAMPVLADRGIALLGGDGDSDVRPSPTPGIHSPIHILAITAMGVPLLDNLDLEAVSAACAEEGRYDFLFVVAPLNVPRGTGSPVNPIAIF